MTYTTGDKGITLTGTCLDGNTPVDLTGATVELHIRVPDATILTRPADVTDAPAGQWSYTWADGDLTIAGIYKIEAQVTSSAGSTIQTFGQGTFQVEPQLA